MGLQGPQSRPDPARDGSFMFGAHAAYMAYTGAATHCSYLTVGLTIFLGYVSAFSFGADYWYGGDKPITEQRKVSECQKQFTCNAIDRANVPIIAIIGITIGMVQFFCAPTMNWAYPAVMVLFGCAVGAQQLGVRCKRRFTDITRAEGYDPQTSPLYKEARGNLWWGTLLHTVWHVVAVVAPLVQVYGLLNHGVLCPKWLSC